MNLTAELAAPILLEYGISGKIKDIGFFMNYSEGQTVKVIARIDVEHRSPLVLKLLHEPEHPHSLIERQCVFSEHLRRNGIPTPERYSKGGQYCLDRIVCGFRVDVTLEDLMENVLQKLDLNTAFRIGRLMARIHRISFRDNFKLGAPSPFNAIGENDVSGIDKLRELAVKAEESRFKSITYPHRYCTKPELCREIIAIYDHKLESIRSIWGRLPCSAVQGDLSINNVYRAADRLGVFDYNNAGDETLVGDMILEGLLTAYETNGDELADGLTDADRPAIFRSFFDGYSSICPLTPDERLAACDIYPIFNALWFSRIDALEGLMKTPGRCVEADEMLTEIYRLISEDARKIFATELF